MRKMLKIMKCFMLSILMEHRWNEIDRGKPKYSVSSATLSTTNPKWTDPGIEPGPPQ
jgi:hypothetical protein